jgi:hypothetical protein
VPAHLLQPCPARPLETLRSAADERPLLLPLPRPDAPADAAQAAVNRPTAVAPTGLFHLTEGLGSESARALTAPPLVSSFFLLSCDPTPATDLAPYGLHGPLTAGTLLSALPADDAAIIRLALVSSGGGGAGGGGAGEVGDDGLDFRPQQRPSLEAARLLFAGDVPELKGRSQQAQQAPGPVAAAKAPVAPTKGNTTASSSSAAAAAPAEAKKPATPRAAASAAAAAASAAVQRAGALAALEAAEDLRRAEMAAALGRRVRHVNAHVVSAALMACPLDAYNNSGGGAAAAAPAAQ